MLRLSLKETDEYGEIRDFFIENGLEFNEEEDKGTEILHVYKITHGDEEHLVGAVSLARRKGELVINGMAVEKIYRKMKIGSILLQKVEEIVNEELGGGIIYLAAKVPGFYKKNDYETIDIKDAPDIFTCQTCPLQGKECFPAIMKKVIK